MKIPSFTLPKRHKKIPAQETNYALYWTLIVVVFFAVLVVAASFDFSFTLSAAKGDSGVVATSTVEKLNVSGLESVASMLSRDHDLSR